MGIKIYPTSSNKHSVSFRITRTTDLAEADRELFNEIEKAGFRPVRELHYSKDGKRRCWDIAIIRGKKILGINVDWNKIPPHYAVIIDHALY